MDWDNAKSFTSHKYNGVLLKFSNGNIISTVWRAGSYSDNHDDDFKIPEQQNGGSMTAEIMFDTHGNKRLSNRIFRKFNTSADNRVIGWVTMDKWLWVVNQLASAK